MTTIKWKLSRLSLVLSALMLVLLTVMLPAGQPVVVWVLLIGVEVFLSLHLLLE